MHSLTWRDICATLIVARDAEMEGRTADAKELLDEVAPDYEWKQRPAALSQLSRTSGMAPDTLYLNPTTYRRIAERVGPLVYRANSPNPANEAPWARRRLASMLTEALSS